MSATQSPSSTVILAQQTVHIHLGKPVPPSFHIVVLTRHQLCFSQKRRYVTRPKRFRVHSRFLSFEETWLVRKSFLVLCSFEEMHVSHPNCLSQPWSRKRVVVSCWVALPSCVWLQTVTKSTVPVEIGRASAQGRAPSSVITTLTFSHGDAIVAATSLPRDSEGIACHSRTKLQKLIGLQLCYGPVPKE